MANTLNRKIFFYRVHAGLKPNGEPIAFDAATTFARVTDLSWTRGDRYWLDEEGNATCCWVENDPRHVRLGISRRARLPRVEQAGELSRLRIPAKAGLAEETHIVFLPDNIVGSEFNFFGPRVSRMRDYLRAKVPDLRAPKFEALLRKDVMQQLEALGEIKLMQLRVRPSFAHTAKEVSEDLGAALDALANVGKTNEVEVLLRAGRRKTLPARIKTMVKRLVHKAELREDARRFVVEGRDARTHEKMKVDLLHDALVATKAIPRDGRDGRGVDSASAYEAIHQAYGGLREELREAAGISED